MSTSKDNKNVQKPDFLDDENGEAIFNKAYEIIQSSNNIEEAFPLLKKAFELGNMDAAYYLGLFYEYGIGCEENIDEANKIYTIGLQHNHPDSMTKLGVNYKTGNGLEVDERKAFALFDAAAKQNDPKALFYLAEYYEDGEVVKEDPEYAFKLLQKSAELGFESAYTRIGMYYFYGQYVDKDYDLAFKFFKKAAELGDNDAFDLLGDCYKNGLGTEINIEKAKKCYEIGFNNDDPDSTTSLAVMYDTGDGVEKDSKKATELYKKAASLGNPFAQVSLGLRYQYGLDCEVNLSVAMELFKEACDQDFDDAYFRLGLLFLDYEEIHNEEIGLKCLNIAVERDVPEACFKLGSLYNTGTYVEQNYELANELFYRAAKKGIFIGALYLGLNLYQGLGCQENVEEAFKFIKFAAEHDVDEAYAIYAELLEIGRGCEKNIPLSIKYHEKAAENGDVDSLLTLGLRYEFGFGCETNPELSTKYLTRALEGGNDEAALTLALKYEIGSGVEKNEFKAFKLLKDRENLDNPKILNKLGTFYRTGVGCEIDYEKAYKLYKKAYELGDISALTLIGEFYENGEYFEKNIEKANKIYAEAAKKGDSDAMLNLADNLCAGNGFEKDYEKAFKFYVLAAKEDNYIAIKQLGYCFKVGLGCEVNNELAIKCFEYALEHNVYSAAPHLGLMYDLGKGVEQDYEKANYYYKLAIKENDADAMLYYATNLLSGNGCKKDYEKAFQLLLNSYNLNNKNAIVQLAKCYFYGLGCEKDFEKARTLLFESLDYEDYHGTGNLGFIYEFGYGVEIDVKKANEIYKLGLDHDISFAGINYATNLKIGKGFDKPDPEKAVEIFKYFASKKDARALVELALCYQDGEGVEKDELKGFNLLKEACDLDDEDAFVKFGIAYQYGVGCEADINKANEFYFKAKERGNTRALVCLANNYYWGDGFEINYQKAIELYEEAALKGDPRAINCLGDCYRYGDGVQIDYNKAFAYYKQVSDSYPPALCNLGICYEYGFGVEKDIDKANEIYKKAAEQGDSRAYTYLATNYLNGAGFDKNIDEALHLFMKAVELKDGRAADIIGDLYSTGRYIPIDYDKAFEYYKKSAELRYSDGYCDLGICYELGWGTDVNAEEAVRNYTKGMELNNERAICNLGDLYLEGLIIPKSVSLAIQCYKAATKLKSGRAFDTLGDLYFAGKDVKKDYTLAFNCHKTAVSLKYSDAYFDLAIAYKKGYGTLQNLPEYLNVLRAGEDIGDVLCLAELGQVYKEGQLVEKNYETALDYFKLAFKFGLEEVESDIEELEELIKKEALAKSRIHLGEARDVFVSWNHLDRENKDKICEGIASGENYTLWESDTDGSGELDEAVKIAIAQAKCFIVILTGNSIQSNWVKQEVQMMFDKNASTIENADTIIPIILNYKTEGDIQIPFRVKDEILKMEEDSPFRKLLPLAKPYLREDNEVDIDKLKSRIKSAIIKGVKLKYKFQIINSFKTFQAAFSSNYKKDLSKQIKVSLDFSSCYLDRPLFNLLGEECSNDCLLENKASLIFGVGGVGKSLYMQNIVKTKFIGNNYIFYIPCKDLASDICRNDDENTFIKILKRNAYDKYFTKDEVLDFKDFENLFNDQNNEIILIDALDELTIDQRKALFEKISVFNKGHRDVKFIFSSRDENDADLINEALDTNETKIYELRGLTENDASKMFDNIDSSAKENSVEMIGNEQKSKNKNTKIYTKSEFFKELPNISDEIKNNPLLLSNLIYIYLNGEGIPTKQFEIIRKANSILIESTLRNPDVAFYLDNNKLNNILGYLTFVKATQSDDDEECNYDETNTIEIFTDFFDNKQEYLKIGDDSEEVATIIYKFLVKRSIIVNGNVAHEIFRDYYAACYLFDECFETVKPKGLLGTKHFEFKQIEGTDLEPVEGFKEICCEYLSFEHNPWPQICVDLISKIDFEINRIKVVRKSDKEDQNLVFYENVLSLTLDEELDTAFSKETIQKIAKLAYKDLMYFKEIVLKHVKLIEPLDLKD